MDKEASQEQAEAKWPYAKDRLRPQLSQNRPELPC